MDRLFDLGIYILFAAVCLKGLRLEQARTAEEYLKRLNALRGIFALEIVVGHVVRYDATLLYPMGKFMIISVAFFFFVSAFGMVHSFYQKPDYLKGFLIRKPFYLFLLAVVIFVFNCTVDALGSWSLGYCDWRGSGIAEAFFSRTNWYLWEQILFYLLFYVIYRYVKKYRVALITVVTLIFATVVFLNGAIQGWYASAMAFPLGLLWGEYTNRCMKAAEKPWFWVLAVVLSMVGLSGIWMGDNLIGMVYLRNIMCIAGILLIVCVVSIAAIGNRLTVWLGKYSVGIYVCQFIYLSISGQTGWDYKLRMGFVVAATILTAIIMKPLFDALRKGCEALGKKMQKG